MSRNKHQNLPEKSYNVTPKIKQGSNPPSKAGQRRRASSHSLARAKAEFHDLLIKHECEYLDQPMSNNQINEDVYPAGYRDASVFIAERFGLNNINDGGPSLEMAVIAREVVRVRQGLLVKWVLEKDALEAQQGLVSGGAASASPEQPAKAGEPLEAAQNEATHVGASSEQQAKADGSPGAAQNGGPQVCHMEEIEPDEIPGCNDVSDRPTKRIWHIDLTSDSPPPKKKLGLQLYKKQDGEGAFDSPDVPVTDRVTEEIEELERKLAEKKILKTLLCNQERVMVAPPPSQALTRRFDDEDDAQVGGNLRWNFSKDVEEGTTRSDSPVPTPGFNLRTPSVEQLTPPPESRAAILQSVDPFSQEYWEATREERIRSWRVAKRTFFDPNVHF